jgi:hypothetical protein
VTATARSIERKLVGGKFYLFDMGLSPGCCKFVSRMVQREGGGLTRLILSQNCLREAGVALLLPALRAAASLVHLNVSSCGLNGFAIGQLAEVLAGHPALYSLDLSSQHSSLANYLNDPGLDKICLLLKNRILQVLNLAATRLHDEGLGKILAALSRRRFESLNLSQNRLMIMPAVFDLCVDVTINELNLSSNFISDKGLDSLVYALAGKKLVLGSLNIARNKVTGRGIARLGQLGQEVLKALDLSELQFWEMFAPVTDLVAGHKLICLRLEGCRLHPGQLKGLRSPWLVELSIRNNPLHGSI